MGLLSFLLVDRENWGLKWDIAIAPLWRRDHSLSVKMDRQIGDGRVEVAG